MTLRDVIRLSYAAIERYQGADDRALLAAMIIWAYQGPSWFRVGEA